MWLPIVSCLSQAHGSPIPGSYLWGLPLPGLLCIQFMRRICFCLLSQMDSQGLCVKEIPMGGPCHLAGPLASCRPRSLSHSPSWCSPASRGDDWTMRLAWTLSYLPLPHLTLASLSPYIPGITRCLGLTLLCLDTKGFTHFLCFQFPPCDEIEGALPRETEPGPGDSAFLHSHILPSRDSIGAFPTVDVTGVPKDSAGSWSLFHLTQARSIYSFNHLLSKCTPFPKYQAQCWCKRTHRWATSQAKKIKSSPGKGIV